MFTDFLYSLRAQGVPVGTQEWLALTQALEQGLEGGTLAGLYHLGRALLIHSEGHYDTYDVCFARYFANLDLPLEIREALKRWLEDPAREAGLQGQPPPELSDKELWEHFQKLLKEQNERHDGGRYFIGTRGVSPVGNAGQNPNGIRVGGQSGNRTAVFMAEERQFQNYRSDVTLDIRQLEVALKGLRLLKRDGPEKLDVDDTVSRSARQAEIELSFRPDRKNSVKLLLLMDVGGSMDPYATLVEKMFSAAHQARHLKRFEFRYFHNCPYGRVYRDMRNWNAQSTEELLKELTPDFRVIFVGDACMAPWELTAGMEGYGVVGSQRFSGLDWIRRIVHHFEDAVWLNPEPRRGWTHPTIRTIHSVLPMYELTLDGLRQAVRHLRVGQRLPLPPA